MKVPIVYLEPDEIVLIHGRLIEDFGGTPGLRDFNLLASAVARPRNAEFLENCSDPSCTETVVESFVRAQ